MKIQLEEEQVQMKLFRRLFNWIIKSDRSQLTDCDPTDHRLPRVDYTNFTLHQASGGLVVETELYDTTLDVYRRKLHVITNDQDLGQELSRILLLENLKK
jgi:hypothetical protein